MKVVLGGEGSNELGGRANPHPYQTDDRGVLEALLRRVRPDGWQVVDAIAWKRIRKFRAGDHADAEERNVRGLVLAAKERSADVVAFSRDADGDGPQHRQRCDAVSAGIAWARENFPDGPAVIGGMAIRMLESWVLASLGEHGTEALRREGLAAALKHQQIPEKDTRAMVARIDDANLAMLPPDATSLRSWLERAGAVLGAAKS